MRNKERKPIQKTSHTQLRRQMKEKTPKTVEILQSRISQRRKLAIKAAISNLTQVPLSLIVLWPNTKCMCTRQDSTMSDKEQLLATEQLPESYELSNYLNSHGAGENSSYKWPK